MLRRYTDTMNTRHLPKICLLLLVVLWGCATRQPVTDSKSTLIAIPAAANPKAAEHASFAQAYAEDSEKGRAALFLLENLPLADRLSMTEAELRENLEYAFLARQTMPWEIPWDIFLHYVLPHRASQEPFQPHRAMLFRELAPLCAKAASMEKALAIVGKWCAQKAEYRPTSRRDLGVNSILEAGYGRCEETNILFLAAARAVGLPVRQAMVPWWQQADGNHAWIEAWTPDGWQFLESGTQFSALNQTWFAAQAPRMPKVAAHAFGHPSDSAVYRTGPGFALLDNTQRYALATKVRLRVTGEASEPVPGLDVIFSIYSMGGLRPVTKAVTNGEGEAMVTLGPGIFFVSCAADDALAWTMLDTRDLETTYVNLQVTEPRPLPASVEFSYPGPAADTFNATLSPELKRIREERARRWEPLLRDLSGPMRERLLLAGERTAQWLRLLHQPAGPSTPWIEPLIKGLDDKDLLQAEPETLTSDIALAVRAREAAAKGGLSYDDEIFERFVLSPRIHFEPWSPWRAQLWTWLENFADQPLEKKIRLVQARISALQTLPPALFGPPLTPGQAHAGGFCASDKDKGVLATAALRTMGVAARYQPDFGGVEYFDGKAWQFLEIEPRPKADGTLRILAGTNPQPLRDFGVARLEDGYVMALDDLPWQEGPSGPTCAMQPGEYLLLTPERSENGTTVRIQSFKVKATKSTYVRLTSKP